jgi:hypothetical protein
MPCAGGKAPIADVAGTRLKPTLTQPAKNYDTVLRLRMFSIQPEETPTREAFDLFVGNVFFWLCTYSLGPGHGGFSTSGGW